VTRNLVEPETAEHNRAMPGGLTFNAEVPDEYEGTIFVIAALRLGDHAHLDIHTGRQVPTPRGGWRPTRHLSRAGRLILRWHEWLVLRSLLDVADVPVVLREVENPTKGNLEIHVG
jgi:hypothetical protein